MKRILTSATAVGIGVFGLSDLQAQEPAEEPLWNFRAKLRGFYDDNYGSLNSAIAGKDDSFGIEVNPVGTYTVDNDGPTQYSVTYDYRMRWFEGRSANQVDNQHLANFSLRNTPNDRVVLNLDNQFAYAQEPGVNEGVITQVRNQSSYVRNNFELGATIQASELVNVRPSYVNRLTDYQLDGVGAISSLLDSITHQPSVDALWNVSEKLTAVTGVEYRHLNYTSDDPIGTRGATNVLPEERDARSVAGYVGVEGYRFTDTLRGTVKLGVEHTSFPNAFAGVDDSILVPYVHSLIEYDLLEDSVARFGVRYGINSTDAALIGAAVQNPVQATKTLTVHGDVSARIAGPLSASLVYQIQHSEFVGGLADGQSDQLYTGGITFGYNLMEGLDLETGVTIDRLDSDLPTRSFTRNRGFIGLNYSY